MFTHLVDVDLVQIARAGQNRCALTVTERDFLTGEHPGVGFKVAHKNDKFSGTGNTCSRRDKVESISNRLRIVREFDGLIEIK